MKIRGGFVSNSSSSSFVILNNDISAKQIKQIINHIEKGKKYDMDNCTEGDAWDIDINDHMISGSTWMDNFNMREFLECIGVDSYVIKWDC